MSGRNRSQFGSQMVVGGCGGLSGNPTDVSERSAGRVFKNKREGRWGKSGFPFIFPASGALAGEGGLASMKGDVPPSQK
jgi:hypothetical protein